jgi:hypothetical protein
LLVIGQDYNKYLSLPQLSKLACIPFTLLAQYLMYKQTVSRWVQMTLLPITFGVGYATVYDLNLNMVGLGTLRSIFKTLPFNSND